MKPSFALDFRDGAIALLHRTSRGWQQVGSTAADAADLNEALSYMRSTALGLSPRGVTTKLVIPNEQILYTQVHAPGPDAAKRKRQIKAALDGLTPYKVDELIYDWWGNGPEVHVAIVARETLAEAEAFATEHRFNPVSFVASPDSGGFAGEPFFGTSSLAASLLAEGEKVERDQDPIAVVAREYPRPDPAPQPAAEPEPAPEAPKFAKAEPEPVAQAEAVVDTAPEIVVAPAPVIEPAPAPVAEPPAPVVEPAPKPEPNPLPDFRAAKAPAAGAAIFDPKAMAVELVDEAPMAVDVPDEPKEPTVPRNDDRAASNDSALDVVPDLPPGAAFASRRVANPEAPAAKATPEAGPSLAVASVTSPTDFAAAAAAAKAKKAPAVGPAPTQRPSVARPAMARPPADPTAPRDAVPFPPKGVSSKFVPGKGAKAGAVAGGAVRERNVVPLPKSALPTGEAGAGQTAAKAKGQTGLDGRPLPVRGKPRFLGLILTALLLIALALVAAWSSFYLSSNEADPDVAETAVADGATVVPTPETAVVATTEPLPTVEDESLADGQDPGLVADASPVADDPVATDTALAEAAAPVTEPAPATTVATEAALAAAPGNDPQDEIFLAAADTPPRSSDPTILPNVVAGSDPPPQAAPPPPPFGTVYTFDAAGRIQPTPEGILTPEGVLLIAGPPSKVPPARPAGLATVETVAPEAAEPAVADPALVGKKPRPRPPGVVDEAATAERQGEVLAPDPNSRFASLRPRGRPEALLQTAAIAPDASAASLAANGIQDSTSALAVTVSRKPAARPGGMEQAVDAAVAAAVQAAEPEPQVAAAAPEADAEPESESAAPAVPSNASVAKQATTKDALNLSKVALLGIFGTSSGRYAMIRQPGGGVKKVKVGDTIDGGRIAAISATAVEYQKGNRMVTLSLPTG